MITKQKKVQIRGQVASFGIMSLLTVKARADTLLDTSFQWLFGLSDWVLLGTMASVFSVFFLLLLLVYNRWRRARAIQPRSSWYALISGAITGVAVALLLAEAWKDHVYQQVISMPPTAAGHVPQRDVGIIADLLADVDPVEAAGLKLKLPQKVMPGRARHAQVNFDAADADTLNLNLFDDIYLVAVRDRIEKMDKGHAVWIGHIEDDEGSSVVLAFKGKAMMGTVETQGHSYEIVYAGGSTHAVREIDANKIPDKFEPENLNSFLKNDSLDMAGDTTGTSTTTTTGGVSTGTVIDILVAYTSKARTNAGGVSGIEARILNAIAQANQAYLNSQINMSLNLLGMVETTYVETGDMGITLSRLGSRADGFMDEIPTVRNQLYADQVVLISADTNYCGISPILNILSTTSSVNAYTVVHDDSVYACMSANNTFAHELGHNQGNLHNIENNGTATGAYPDSYGYRLDGVFRDIMAYASTTGEPRIQYFSNPNILYNGQPIGILGSADTARSMNATAPLVASFRVPPSATVPNAPGSLAASVLSTSAIDLSWADNATDETGYYVQRSLDGTTWSLIATLGSNAVSFSDSALTAGTTYYYRAYAYSSVGNSVYSNTATATTAVVAQTTDSISPIVTISNPSQSSKVNATSQSINVSATDNVGVKSLQLYIDNKLVSSTNSSSLSYTWSTKRVASGNHSIMTKAGDAAGNSSSLSITVTK